MKHLFSILPQAICPISVTSFRNDLFHLYNNCPRPLPAESHAFRQYIQFCFLILAKKINYFLLMLPCFAAYRPFFIACFYRLFLLHSLVKRTILKSSYLDRILLQPLAFSSLDHSK